MPTSDYPYLAHWKAQGLDRFPDIPFDKFVRPNLEKMRRTYRQDHAFLQFEAAVIPGGREAQEKELLEQAVQLTGARLMEKIASLGLQLLKAQKDARFRKSRGTVINDLLPDTRGVAPTPSELLVLKRLYREIQGCIKEARRANDLPLKKTDDFASQARQVNLLEGSPWLADLFKADEIPLMIARPAVADCALEILHRRLMLPISKRTLKDLLKSLPN